MNKTKKSKLIGRRYDTTKSGKVEIIDVIKNRKKILYYIIKFVDTGHMQNEKSFDRIRYGRLRDTSQIIRNLYGGYNSDPTLIDSYWYERWNNVLRRCHRDSTYENVSICEEWYDFKNFHDFVIDPKNGFKPGYHLDKDIICSARDERIYSPDTCLFIPQILNNFLVNRSENRTRPFPSGLSTNEHHKKNKIFASIQIFDDKVSLVSGNMDDKNDILKCFCYYKLAKEYFIHKVVDLLLRYNLINHFTYRKILDNYQVHDSRINSEFTIKQCKRYINYNIDSTSRNIVFKKIDQRFEHYKDRIISSIKREETLYNERNRKKK